MRIGITRAAYECVRSFRAQQRFKALSFCTVFLLILSSQQGFGQDLRKIALVVGNGSYTAVQSLPNAKNDAELVAATLKSLGFAVQDDGARKDLTLSQFNSSIQQFANDAGSADVAIFYYAGHGLQVAGTNYLVPIDATLPNGLSDVPSQLVDAGRVLDALDKTTIKLKIMLLDACRNNPFTSRGILPTARGLADMSRGLTAMNAPAGSAIWYATQPGNVALDGSGNNGPFALAVSHNIVVPGLDIFGVFNKVSLEVMDMTSRAQVPWIAASGIYGEFYFVKAGPGPIRSTFTESRSLSSPTDNVKRLFSSGFHTASANFRFGDSDQDVNRSLDTPFALGAWEALPRATEYGNDEVRYFWVYLPSLPAALSVLTDPNTMNNHCIDPQSYIAFFFNKDRKLFHMSIRLYRSQSCPSYDWLLNAVFSQNHRNALVHAPDGDAIVIAHEGNQYSTIDITQQQAGSIWIE